MIDLTQLPPPKVIETLSFEAIRDDMLADLAERAPELADLLPSDPAFKVLEVAAYRELLVRARVNDAARALLLPYSKGTDLDVLAALVGVTRLEGEEDPALLLRVLLAPAATSTAGPQEAYEFFAASASPDVKGAKAWQAGPGVVRVAVLSHQGDGTAPQELVDIVKAVLANGVRPLSDTVEVVSASVHHYTVHTKLQVFPGPDSDLIKATSAAKLQELVDELHALGRDVMTSALEAAAFVSGCKAVALSSPAADLIMGDGEVAFCDGVTVEVELVAE